MAKRRSKLSSISEAEADNFLKDDGTPQRSILGCEYIKGFHLLKLAKGGTWRYRYTDPTGKRKVVSVGSFPAMKPEEAAEIVAPWSRDPLADPAREYEEKKRRRNQEDEARANRTLGAYLEGRYSKFMEAWPPRSATLNRQRIEKHFSHLLDLPMDEIGHHHIEQWQQELEKKGRAHSTVQRVYTSLKALLRQAVAHKIITHDPLSGFTLEDPSYTEQKAAQHRNAELQTKRRLLTDDEVLALHRGLDALAETVRQRRRNSREHGKAHLPDLDSVAYPHWFQPFCLVALHTGLRPGDIYTLTWQELNINFGVLNKVTGKSARSIRKGKGGTVVEMRLNKRIHAILKDWHEQNGKPDAGLVFPSPITGKQLALTAHHRPWETVKELGELPKELDFYCLRHHFVSALVKQGLPLLAVAKLTGHKSTDMIQKHYGHHCPEQAALAVDVLAQNLDNVLSAEKGSAI